MMVEKKDREKEITEHHAHTSKCGRCGCDNIVDNKICGHCGANLPFVYDQGGRAVQHKRIVYEVKVSPYMRRFTRLVIIVAIGLGVFLIIKALRG